MSICFYFSCPMLHRTIVCSTYREAIVRLATTKGNDDDDVSPDAECHRSSGNSHSAQAIFADGSPALYVEGDSFRGMLEQLWRGLHAYDPAILDDLADPRERESQPPIRPTRRRSVYRNLDWMFNPRGYQDFYGETDSESEDTKEHTKDSSRNEGKTDSGAGSCFGFLKRKKRSNQ